MNTEKGLTALVAAVSERRPPHAQFIQDAFRFLEPGERAEADAYISHIAADRSLEFLAESYETILDDTVKAQFFFMREGRYQFSRFEEVADSVYFNNEYMQRYMVGLAVTNYLWPNHVQIHRFFTETFPYDKQGSYLEVGPGHGLFLLQAMRKSRLSEFVGLDISAASLALTDEAVRAILPQARDRLRLIQADFLAESADDSKHDVVVMGEVLEHVEQPKAFLTRLRSRAADGAHVFVTTCINAPAIDHITLFSNEAEVEKLITQSGFSIQRQLAVPYFGKTLQQSVAARLPINVAYVLTP
ncbi:MAG: hypothetical protein JWQ90_4957 [Hydrocarboniphaga sp.]|uniref:class I SAM-dependent methyltransferase n=1 Tax=Hydrocarboniphaga sp. TaxID=2033016 RepID=UPI002634DC76|nr:class I SAM-dependent methyltransferase [Hydrocarboniphaga sp.]MDB5972507.1 hypothetical protein [Hydrocarboniphaga sp.]